MIKTFNDPGLLVRILAFYIMFLFITGAAAIVAYGYFAHQTVPEPVYSLLSVLFGIALHNLGLSQGIKLTNSDTADALKKLAAQVNQQGGDNAT